MEGCPAPEELRGGRSCPIARHRLLCVPSLCGACHPVGTGDAVGPDLAGVTTRRDRDWLVRYLRHPDQMRADKDPTAVALAARFKDVPMPNLRLSDGEIAALLSFLEAQSASPHGHRPDS